MKACICLALFCVVMPVLFAIMFGKPRIRPIPHTITLIGWEEGKPLPLRNQWGIEKE